MISEQKCNPCLRFILLPMSGLHNPFTKIPSPLRGEGWVAEIFHLVAFNFELSTLNPLPLGGGLGWG